MKLLFAAAAEPKRQGEGKAAKAAAAAEEARPCASRGENTGSEMKPRISHRCSGFLPSPAPSESVLSITVNCVDDNGDTPLILASWKGHVEMARLLVNEASNNS